MTLASNLQAVQQGIPLGPVQRSLASWDGQITAEAVERVNHIRMKDVLKDRSDGSGRFRPSLLGSCLRMQMLSYRGYVGKEANAVGREIMRDGTYRHYFWQEVGLSAGFLREVEAPVSHEAWKFSGQIDGLMAEDPIYGPNGGFELKTTNEKSYSNIVKNGRPLDKHLKQIGAYCEAAGLEWFSVVYEQRSYRVEWTEYVVVYDKGLMEMTESVIGELIEYEAREELPPIKDGYPRDNECATWCSYKSICPVARF